MVKKFFTQRKLNICLSIACVVLMWVVWIIAYYSVKNDYVIPSFTATCKSLFSCFGEKSFWTAFSWTLLRTFEAFLISFILAAALAAAVAAFKPAAAFLKPFMAFVRTVPTLAVILILLVWTSASVAPVIVTVLVLFPLIYSQTITAIGNVDGELLQMAQSFGVKKRESFLKIFLPPVAYNLLSQTGANLSLGLKVMISAEVLAATSQSLGGLMQTARGVYYDMPRLAALTLVAVFCGLLLDVAFSALARVCGRWTEVGND